MNNVMNKLVNGAIPWIDWRVGRGHFVLPAAVHATAIVAAVDLALERPWVWMVVGALVLSAIDEAVRVLRERGVPRVLGLCPGGITIDALEYRARRARLGPGSTAVWLGATGGQRRLLYVLRGEATPADHAALRRHLKALDFT